MIGATSNFLLPNATIIPEAITFLVLLFIIAKYVVPPVRKAMNERQAHITQSLEVIEQAKTAEEETRTRTEAMLEEARREARARIDHATRMGEQLREEARRRGEEEAERAMARAQTEIDRASQRASEELRQHLAELVVAASEHVIGREMGTEVQRNLVDEVIGEVETSA